MIKYILLFAMVGIANASSLSTDIKIFNDEITSIEESLTFFTEPDEFDVKYQTLQILKKAVIERKKLLKYDRVIVVNVNEYKLRIYHDGDVVMEQKVIVGRKSRPTPVFVDTLTHVVLNPYWNVPNSLAKKDVIPKIQKDKSTITRNGYEIVSHKTNKVYPIRNGSINLTEFRIRQKPGPRNSLGLVKFMFPYNERRSIFLHDTNSKHLFDRDVRRFSSGCIRLSKPFKLAAYLLDMKSSEITNNMKGKERWVKIKNPISVHVVKWDAHIDIDGNIKYWSGP